MKNELCQVILTSNLVTKIVKIIKNYYFHCVLKYLLFTSIHLFFDGNNSFFGMWQIENLIKRKKDFVKGFIVIAMNP